LLSGEIVDDYQATNDRGGGNEKLSHQRDRWSFSDARIVGLASDGSQSATQGTTQGATQVNLPRRVL